MRKIRALLFSVVAGAALSMIASLAVPTPSGENAVTFHIYLALALVVAVLYIGAAIIFIAGLGGFTQTFRRAYTLLCVGLSILGVANLQLPVLMALGDLDGLWKQSGIIILPYVAGLVLLYTGSRLFARMLGVRNITTAIWFYIAAPVALAILLSVLPHAPTVVSELEFDAANAFAAWNASGILLSGLLIYQAKRAASVVYTNPTAWFFIACMTMLTASLGHMVSIFLLGDDRSNIIALAAMGPLALAGVFLLRSAYSFNRITAQGGDIHGWTSRDFFGKPLYPKASHTVTSVDIIVYAASLASRPHEIDHILDALRQITSLKDSDSGFSPDQEQTLLEIYLKIEHYLLESERLRKFTDRSSLRQHIANKILPDTQTTFWGRL